MLFLSNTRRHCCESWGVPWEPGKVLSPAVNHWFAFRCALHTLCRVPAQRQDLFIYFRGRIHFGLWDGGSGSGGGCLVSRACSELHTQPCSLSWEPSPVLGKHPVGRGPASWTPGEHTTEVSGSSPPIGQFSKSAFKFSFSFLQEGGGQGDPFLLKFFSLYVDANKQLCTGHVQM